MAAITRALAGVLLRPRMQGAVWYGAAEAAIATIYQLHPAPGQLCAAVVQGLADAAIGAPSRPSAKQLSEHCHVNTLCTGILCQHDWHGAGSAVA